MECLSYCIADTIDLTRLDNYYKSRDQDYISVKSRDVLKLSPRNALTNLVFVFKNGTVVSWGLKRYQIDYYLEVIKQFADKPIAFTVQDEFSYQYDDKTTIEPHDFFDIDCLLLEDYSDELKLGLSYGFSQSVKLQYFETTIEGLIEKYTPLIHSLSKKTRNAVSRHKIHQVIGEILRATSEMNLTSNFLYLPKYFWQHPTLEANYTMLERYLHIQRRVNTMNHRLDTLNEIFDMFSSYLDSRHSHTLEIVIIILIAIEIIFGVMNLHI